MVCSEDKMKFPFFFIIYICLTEVMVGTLMEGLFDLLSRSNRTHASYDRPFPSINLRNRKTFPSLKICHLFQFLKKIDGNGTSSDARFRLLRESKSKKPTKLVNLSLLMRKYITKPGTQTYLLIFMIIH